MSDSVRVGGGTAAFDGSRLRAGPGLRASRALTVLAVLISAASYVFFVSAGKLSGWPTHSYLYDLLAAGFRTGHLHLVVAPSPLLLQQPNPYDPVNLRLWVWDTTLHDGQFYLYWGPVPALLLVLVKSLFGLKQQAVGDQYLVLAFLLLRLAAGSWLVWALLRRCFDAVPAWLAPLAVLVLGLAGPLPFFASRPAIYEAAIAGGQGFSVLGLALAFAGMSRRQGRCLLLAGASVCWGLALGCRVSLAVAMAGLAVLTSAALLRCHVSQHRRWLTVMATCGPLLASFALLGLYNHARFGSFSDFGVREQLTTMKFTLSLAHLPANVYSYLLRAPAFSCEFPFIRAPWQLGADAFPPGFVLPRDHVAAEPVLGLLRGLPYLLLAIPAAGALLQPRLRRTVWAPGVDGISSEWLAAWIFSALLVLATLPLLPALGLWMATMRYEVDVAAALVLLGTMGAAVLLTGSQGARRWAARTLVIGLAGVSVLVGFLMGFQGYDDQMKNYNRPLYRSLQKITVCRPG